MTVDSVVGFGDLERLRERALSYERAQRLFVGLYENSTHFCAHFIFEGLFCGWCLTLTAVSLLRTKSSVF